MGTSRDDARMSNQDSESERPHLLLEAEVAFYETQRARWIEQGHAEQWVAVKGTDVLGFFASMGDAYAAGVTKLGSEPFLIKQVVAEDPIAIIKRAELRKRA